MTARGHKINRKVINLQTRLYLIAAIILLAGLGSAVMIYLAADNDSGSVLGYEIVDGHSYPIRPEDSKTYRHDLELYGGTMNVLADDLKRWFTGLFYGKSLAYTIACITIMISSVFLFVAYNSSSDHKSDAPDEST